jgi:hypothetical protein
MLTDSANMFNWSYLLLLLLPAIYYGIKIFDRLRQKERIQSNAPATQTGIEGLLKIEQRELSRRPPVILSIISLISACILLAFGVLIMYIWISGTVEFRMDISTFFFFLLFIGLPLFIIIDTIRDDLFIQPKYYKLGRSHVAKEAKVTVVNDADTVFDACYRVLRSMQATIRIMEKPRLLEAKIKDSVMTIKLRRIKGSKVQIYILSDNKWFTAKFDAGVNQRNVDSFLQELDKQ